MPTSNILLTDSPLDSFTRAHGTCLAVRAADGHILEVQRSEARHDAGLSRAEAPHVMLASEGLNAGVARAYRRAGESQQNWPVT